MIKRYILGILFVLMLIGAGAAVVASQFYGNPISEWQNKKAAEKYISESGKKDIKISSSDYNYKTGIYEFSASSESGKDSNFKIGTKDGKVILTERAEDFIRKTQLQNTWERLSGEYRLEAEKAMEEKMKDKGLTEFKVSVLPDPRDDEELADNILKLADTDYNRKLFEDSSKNIQLKIIVTSDTGTWDKVFEATKVSAQALYENNMKPNLITVIITKGEEPLIGVYDVTPETVRSDDFNVVIDQYLR